MARPGRRGPRSSHPARAFPSAARSRAARAAETQKRPWAGSSSAAVRVAGERGSGAAAGDGEPGGGRAARERRAGRRLPGTEAAEPRAAPLTRGSAVRRCDRARSAVRPGSAGVLAPRLQSPRFHFSGKRRRVTTPRLGKGDVCLPHHLPEFAQINVHCMHDDIQLFHPLIPSSPSAFNISQHQRRC